MENSIEKLTFEKHVNAPAAQVYREFTNSSALREWLCDFATTDPKPGGRIYMWWNSGYYSSGEFTSVDEDKLISFTWFGRAEPDRTHVDITFNEKEGGTLVRLVHHGIGAGAEWETVVKEYEKGWGRGLENLASVLESGPDLRVVRRPMLGILINEFNEDIAGNLGIPVNLGVRIDHPITGMGAEAAGLTKDDVIVGMGSKPITDFTSLSTALSGYYAGDVIDVEFYRGAQKKSVAMTLSSRQIPEIPPTGKGMSDAVRSIHNQVYGELKEFLDGVSDEEATFKPSVDEWSINEIMGHLIHGEEDFHIFIQDLISGQEAWYDDYGGNVQARIDATMAVNPTKQDLLNELKRSTEETLTMLARLPEEFHKRKGSYWRLGYNILQSPYHFEIHKEQMQAALEAARGKKI
jgi:uncharacterized protein YndB with AHSA1/START domain